MDSLETNILTPKTAKDYLQFKVNKNKDVFEKRNRIVPHYLSPGDFCHMVNDVRTAIWKYNDEERKLAEKQLEQEIVSKEQWDIKENKPQGKKIKKEDKFERAIKEVVMPFFGGGYIPLGDVKSLIGIFMRIFKDREFQEYINNVKSSIGDTLTSNLERDNFTTKEVVQETDDGNQTTKGIESAGVPISSEVDDLNVGASIRETLISNPEGDNFTTKDVAWEVVVNSIPRSEGMGAEDISTSSEVDDFDQIIEQLKQVYFIDQWLGDPSSADMEDLFNQAWRGFIETEGMRKISDEKRTQLYRYLYKKHIRQEE